MPYFLAQLRLAQRLLALLLLAQLLLAQLLSPLHKGEVCRKKWRTRLLFLSITTIAGAYFFCIIAALAAKKIQLFCLAKGPGAKDWGGCERIHQS